MLIDTHHLKSIELVRFNELNYFPKKYFNNLAIRIIIKGFAETTANMFYWMEPAIVSELPNTSLP